MEEPTEAATRREGLLFRWNPDKGWWERFEEMFLADVDPHELRVLLVGAADQPYEKAPTWREWEAVRELARALDRLAEFVLVQSRVQSGPFRAAEGKLDELRRAHPGLLLAPGVGESQGTDNRRSVSAAGNVWVTLLSGEEVRRFGPLRAGDVSLGVVCPDCSRPCAVGEYVTLRTTDHSGGWNAAASVAHWKCVTGEDR